jgi:hypothetical protein
MNTFIKMQKILSLVIVALVLSCVKDPITPAPIVKILPKRPVGVSVDGVLNWEITYNSVDTAILQIGGSSPSIEFDYDTNGKLFQWGLSSNNQKRRFFNHTNDSSEIITVDDATGDTINVGNKSIIRYDLKKRVIRTVEFTNYTKRYIGEYEYDTLDNISRFNSKTFTSSGSIIREEEYFATYDTLLNPFYYEKNHYVSTVFGSDFYFFNMLGGSKYCPKSVVGPYGTEYQNTYEYDYSQKRISQILHKYRNTPTEIIGFIY